MNKFEEKSKNEDEHNRADVPEIMFIRDMAMPPAVC